MENTNHIITYFVSGLSFFSLGLVILSKINAIFPLSQLFHKNISLINKKILNSVKYFALFSILHGISQWLYIFYLLNNNDNLFALKIFLNTLSYLILFLLFLNFYILSRYIKYITLFLLTFIQFSYFLYQYPINYERLIAFENFTGYTIAFPSIILTAWIFLSIRKAKDFLNPLSNYSLLAFIGSLIIYAFLTILKRDNIHSTLKIIKDFVQNYILPIDFEYFRTLDAVLIFTFFYITFSNLAKRRIDYHRKLLTEKNSRLESANEMYKKELKKRQDIENSLFQNEEKYRSMIDEASDLIFLLNKSGEIIEVNKQSIKILEYSEEELLKMAYRDLISDDDLINNPISFKQILSDKKVIEHRTLLSKNGKKIKFESNSFLLNNGNIEIIFRDLTEREVFERKNKRINNVLRVLSQINSEFINHDSEFIFMESCSRILIQQGNFSLTVISSIELSTYRMDTISVESRKSFINKGQELASLYIWDFFNIKNNPKYLVFDARHPNLTRISDNIKEFDFQRVILAPIFNQNNKNYYLSIFDPDEVAFDKHEVKLLLEVVESIQNGIQFIKNKNEKTIIEKKLKENEERLNLIFRQLPALLWTCDDRLKITSLMGTVMSQLNINFNEDSNLSVFELFESFKSDEIINTAHFNALLGEASSFEYKWKNIYFKIIIESMYNNDDEIIGAIGLALDIADIKYVEQELVLEKNKAQQYLDIIGVILVVIDIDGNINLINRKGYEILGIESNESINFNWFEEFVHPSDLEYVRLLFSNFFNGFIDTLHHNEYSIINRKNEVKLIRWHKSAIKNIKNEIQGVLFSGEDITSQRIIEDQLHYQLKLESILFNISDYFLNIPHEKIDNAIKKSLESIGEFISTDRVTITKTINLMSSSNEYIWTRKPEFTKKLSVENSKLLNFTWIESNLLNSDLIKINSEGSLGHLDETEKNKWRDLGLKSILINKLKFSDSLYGYICLENFDNERNWEDKDIRFIKTFSEILVNIFKRQETENELIESKRKYQLITETANDMITLQNSEGSLQYISPVCKEMLGIDIDEVINKAFINLFIEEDQSIILEQFKMIKNADFLVPITVRAKTKSGDIRWLEIISKSFDFNNTPDSSLILSVSRNVTERKLIEKTLIESESKFRRLSQEFDALLNAISDPIILVDKKLDIVWANNSFCNMVNKTMEEIQGSISYQIWTYCNSDKKNCLSNKTFQNKKFNSETVKDANNRFWEVRAYPIFDDEENIINVIELGTDITEKIQLEKELIKSQKLESLGVLAGGIAHNFNNLLTGITSNLSLAKLSIKENHEIYENIIESEKILTKARDVSKQLITFSKGGMPSMKTLNVESLLKETVQFTLTGSKINTEFFIENDLFNVEIDSNLITQVINNIVLNAREAMNNNGNMVISAKNLIQPSESYLSNHDNWLRMSFQDSGPGIPEEYQNKIFDPYFSSKPFGSGLGLATSHTIIKQHKGHLNFDSSSNGTTFYIDLPSSNGAKLDSGLRSALDDKQIIFISQDKSSIKRNQELLSSLGYEIDSFMEINEIRDNLFEKPCEYKLIIIDEGFISDDILLKLNIEPEKTKLIALTNDENKLKESHKKYFNSIIEKPFSINELEKEIRKLDIVIN